MGHDNIAKLASLLVKLHRAPSGWLCLHPRPDRSSSNGDGGNQRRRIKLVRSDGSLEVYNRPIVVSELTRDFPKHKICRSDSLYIGQKTPVLSETDTLKLGLNYFLLPSDFFTNDLSFLTIAALKSPQKGGVLVRKSAGTHHQQPFLIQKGGTGEKLKIRVSEDFMSELMMERRKDGEKEEEEEGEGGESEGRVCTTVKLKKDYVQLVGLRKWKPKLETITETKAMKATVEKKTKRRKFPVTKKRSCKDSSQIEPCAKRKLQSKFKSRTKKAILRKIA